MYVEEQEGGYYVAGTRVFNRPEPDRISREHYGREHNVIRRQRTEGS